jgi:hypothetical protein
MSAEALKGAGPEADQVYLDVSLDGIAVTCHLRTIGAGVVLSPTPTVTKTAKCGH